MGNDDVTELIKEIVLSAELTGATAILIKSRLIKMGSHTDINEIKFQLRELELSGDLYSYAVGGSSRRWVATKHLKPKPKRERKSPGPRKPYKDGAPPGTVESNVVGGRHKRPRKP